MEQFCMEESEGCTQESIRFIPMSLDGIGLVLELPEGFYQMEEDRQHRYYPRKGRPEIILENGSGVQITAQPLNQKAESARIRFAAEEVCLLTKEMFPRYEISPVYLCREGRLSTGWFQMEMTDIKEGQDWILGTFYCPFEEYGQWQPTVWEILRTIREEQNEGI